MRMGPITGRRRGGYQSPDFTRWLDNALPLEGATLTAVDTVAVDRAVRSLSEGWEPERDGPAGLRWAGCSDAGPTGYRRTSGTNEADDEGELLSATATAASDMRASAGACAEVGGGFSVKIAFFLLSDEPR